MEEESIARRQQQPRPAVVRWVAIGNRVGLLDPCWEFDVLVDAPPPGTLFPGTRLHSHDTEPDQERPPVSCGCYESAMNRTGVSSVSQVARWEVTSGYVFWGGCHVWLFVQGRFVRCCCQCVAGGGVWFWCRRSWGWVESGEVCLWWGVGGGYDVAGSCSGQWQGVDGVPAYR